MHALALPRPPLDTVLRSPELQQMLPSLLVFTARTLRDGGSACRKAPDVLHDVLVECLAGLHEWPDDMTLRTFLYRVIRNRAFCANRTAARDGKHVRAVEVLPEVAAPVPPCDEQIDDRRLLSKIEAVAARDPETEKYLSVVEDGNTDDQRADHAEAAEWSPERVSRVERRFTHRLDAEGLLPRKGGGR